VSYLTRETKPNAHILRCDPSNELNMDVFALLLEVTLTSSTRLLIQEPHHS